MFSMKSSKEAAAERERQRKRDEENAAKADEKCEEELEKSARRSGTARARPVVPATPPPNAADVAGRGTNRGDEFVDSPCRSRG